MRRWPFFIACLLLSASIWLVYNLSQVHTSIVSQEVVAESSLEGRAARSSDAVTMAARVSASGFRLLSVGLRKGSVTVQFAPEDLSPLGDDYFGIPSSKLLRYAGDIYGQGAKVEAFLFDEASFRFIPENNRRVPLRAVCLPSFRAQYTQVSPLALKPDSVTVYGPAEVLDRVEEVRTASFSLSDLHGNVHGEVKLVPPPGTRLSERKTEYSIEVSRYVELETESPLTVRNLPSGVALRVYPSTVTAVFRCVFPLLSDPRGMVDFHVDYGEFARSITGRCVVHHGALPKGVISCSITPDVVECVETADE